ncbi:MAG TPA: hypothetical protein VFE58_01360 [Tepidisphaeraceae bacterium]|jgi:hypothetical protein|nr:hypothetical protein [Tepidisphaeraceae bacterium]
MTTPPDLQPNQILREVSWRELFGWVHLFRTFRIAIHPSKLALAWLLLLCLYLGGRALDYTWTLAAPHSVPLSVERINWPATPSLYSDNTFLQNIPTLPREGVFIKFFQYEVGQVDQTVQSILNWNWLSPGGVLSSIANFLLVGPAWFYGSHPVFASIFTLWFLIIWAVFGGAVARIAAVHVARDEKMSVRQAIRFSSGKMLSFIFAPIIPLVLILLITALLALAGLVLLNIPYAGPIILSVFFFLPLLAGAILTLLLLGTGAGFNLMYPTIAIEGSDSFDAISRSFSYVYHRPWRLIWYTAVALTYGAVCYLFIRFFIFMTLTLTQYFLGWWLPAKSAAQWPSIWPPIEFWHLSSPLLDLRTLPWSENVTAWFVSFWVYWLITMLGAFAISFYFSANTIIYSLLRREVDATDLDDVYVEEIEEEFTESPPIAPEKVATPGFTSTPQPPESSPSINP